jgi:hypothetical protein
MLDAVRVVTEASGVVTDVKPLTVPPITDAPVNVVALRVATPARFEAGSIVMVVLSNPPPVVPDHIAIPELFVVAGVVIEDPGPVELPEIVIRLALVVMVTLPTPASVLKFRSLLVFVPAKTDAPPPRLLPLITTSFPDCLITVPVSRFAPTVAPKTDVKPLTVDATKVVPLMLVPVKLVALIVVAVINGEVIDVKPLTVDATSVVPLMFVPVMFVALSVVTVARGDVSDVVLVMVWAFTVTPVMSVVPVILVKTAVVPVCI